MWTSQPRSAQLGTRSRAEITPWFRAQNRVMSRKQLVAESGATVPTLDRWIRDRCQAGELERMQLGREVLYRWNPERCE